MCAPARFMDIHVPHTNRHTNLYLLITDAGDGAAEQVEHPVGRAGDAELCPRRRNGAGGVEGGPLAVGRVVAVGVDDT